MDSFNLLVSKTARYFTLGELNSSTQHIWFVCHGYGQLANYFLKKFEVLNDSQTFIVAPEALNKFYLEGFSGRVGATWMTKEDRLNDIHDYISYLNNLYETVLSGVNTAQITIHILGFSQGTATVCRWVADGKVKADRLILWAGFFPPDLEHGLSKNVLSQIKMYVVFGSQDEFLQAGSIESYLNDFKKSGFSPAIIQFEGRHEIDTDTLLQLQQF